MTRTLPAALLLIAALATRTLGASSNDAPRIACAEPAYDFGALDNSRAIAHTFTISNAGSAELVIGNVRACCGSTARLDHDRLPPGSNATLAVTLSLAGRTGPIHKSIYLASNDPIQPFFRISLSGAATAAIRPAQPDAIAFGEVTGESPASRSVSVPIPTNATFAVTNLTVEGTNLTATVARTNDGYLVTATLTPPLTSGAMRGKVTLFTDRPGHGRMTVPVTATVLDDLVPIPDTLRLAALPGATDPVSRCLSIRSRTGRPVAVRNVGFPGEGAQVAIRQDGTNSCLIEIQGIRPLPALNGKDIVISFSRPEGREIRVPIRVHAGEK